MGMLLCWHSFHFFFFLTDLPGFWERNNERVYLPIGKLGGRSITFLENKEIENIFSSEE